MGLRIRPENLGRQSDHHKVRHNSAAGNKKGEFDHHKVAGNKRRERVNRELRILLFV